MSKFTPDDIVISTADDSIWKVQSVESVGVVRTPPHTNWIPALGLSGRHKHRTHFIQPEFYDKIELTPLAKVLYGLE